MVNQQFAFAVHILAMLAYSDQMIASRTIAISVNTNPVVVRRLLLALRSAGLIATRSGKNGGAVLLKKPARISLLDIYEAVEQRPVIAISKRDPFKRCPVSCSMRQIMSDVSNDADNAIRSHLRQVTLEQLVRRVNLRRRS